MNRANVDFLKRPIDEHGTAIRAIQNFRRVCEISSADSGQL